MINTPKYIQLGLFAMAFFWLNWASISFSKFKYTSFCYVTVFITSLLILLLAHFAHFRTFWTQTVFFQTKSRVLRLKPYAWNSISQFLTNFRTWKGAKNWRFFQIIGFRYLKSGPIFPLEWNYPIFILKWWLNKNDKFSWVILGPQEWIIKNWISVFLICCRYKFLSCECLITFCIRF